MYCSSSRRDDGLDVLVATLFVKNERWIVFLCTAQNSTTHSLCHHQAYQNVRRCAKYIVRERRISSRVLKRLPHENFENTTIKSYTSKKDLR